MRHFPVPGDVCGQRDLSELNAIVGEYKEFLDATPQV